MVAIVSYMAKLESYNGVPTWLLNVPHTDRWQSSSILLSSMEFLKLACLNGWWLTSYEWISVDVTILMNKKSFGSGYQKIYRLRTTKIK